MGVKAVLELVNSLFFLMCPCICWNLLTSRLFSSQPRLSFGESSKHHEAPDRNPLAGGLPGLHPARHGHEKRSKAASGSPGRGQRPIRPWRGVLRRRRPWRAAKPPLKHGAGSRRALRKEASCPAQPCTIYALGEGAPQDLRQAKEWLGRTCDGGSQLGCEEYARFSQMGY